MCYLVSFWCYDSTFLNSVNNIQNCVKQSELNRKHFFVSVVPLELSEVLPELTINILFLIGWLESLPVLLPVLIKPFPEESLWCNNRGLLNLYKIHFLSFFHYFQVYSLFKDVRPMIPGTKKKSNYVYINTIWLLVVEDKFLTWN